MILISLLGLGISKSVRSIQLVPVVILTKRPLSNPLVLSSNLSNGACSRQFSKLARDITNHLSILRICSLISRAQAAMIQTNVVDSTDVSTTLLHSCLAYIKEALDRIHPENSSKCHRNTRQFPHKIITRGTNKN